jgi:hypothetical protein
MTCEPTYLKIGLHLDTARSVVSRLDLCTDIDLFLFRQGFSSVRSILGVLRSIFSIISSIAPTKKKFAMPGGRARSRRHAQIDFPAAVQGHNPLVSSHSPEMEVGAQTTFGFRKGERNRKAETSLSSIGGSFLFYSARQQPPRRPCLLVVVTSRGQRRYTPGTKEFQFSPEMPAMFQCASACLSELIY